MQRIRKLSQALDAELGRVRIGQPARFEVAAFPGETFAGKLTFVYPTLDPASRTLRVRLELRNRPGPAGLMLRPGLYGNVVLATAQSFCRTHTFSHNVSASSS